MKRFYTINYVLVFLSVSFFTVLFSCQQKKANTKVAVFPAATNKPSPDTQPNATILATQLKIDDELVRIITKMQEDVENLQVTGVYDMDLVKLMSIQHIGAVEMISLQLRSGKDEKLKKINEEVLKAEKKEMTAIMGMVSEFRLKPGDQADSVPSEASRKVSENLFNEMRSTIDSMLMTVSSGNPDKDFAAVIIQYQKGVVAISRKAAKQSKSAKLKKLSLNIVTDKADELKRYQEWLKKSGREVAKLENKSNLVSVRK